MEITVQQLHDYFSLVRSGDIDPVPIPGCEGSDAESLLVPWIDGDKVVLFDMSSNSKIHLSDVTKNTIIKTLDTLASP